MDCSPLLISALCYQSQVAGVGVQLVKAGGESGRTRDIHSLISLEDKQSNTLTSCTTVCIWIECNYPTLLEPTRIPSA